MTPLDRLLAAICDEGPVPRMEQAELVDAVLHRKVRVDSGRPVLPPESLCPNCHVDLDEWGYCDMCAHQELPAIAARLARSLRERAPLQEED